jgi:transposase
MTRPRRYKRFSSEFKREAIMRASEEGMTDKAVCDELGVGTRQFRRWRDELALLGKDAFPGTGVTRDQELEALKRRRSRRSLVGKNRVAHRHCARRHNRV